MRMVLRDAWLGLAFGVRAMLPGPISAQACEASARLGDRFGGAAVLIISAITATGLAESVASGRSGDFDPVGISTAIATWAIFAALLHALTRRGNVSTTMAGLLGATAGLSIAWNLALAATAAHAIAITDAVGGITLLVIYASLVGWLLIGYGRIGHAVSSGETDPFRMALALPIAAAASLALLPYRPMFEPPESTLRLPTVWDAAEFVARMSGAADDQPPQPARPPIDVEAVWDRQPQLVAKALAGLTPTPATVPQVYFVGAALYANQDVFLREATSSRDVVDAQFGSSGRSVLLLNHADTLAERPLASATNLDKILAGMAKVMDVEKDILVLFLTSHGNKGTLSVTMPHFFLNQLKPERLAAMLDKSGIKHRVIILSACHAGSFIPALENPNTLVLAAAHADKASFGCSHEREWTYFGDALFNHALRKTRSFTTAFRMASETVAGWEKAKGLTPSEPQMFVGADIEARLLALERHLDADPGPDKPADE